MVRLQVPQSDRQRDQETGSRGPGAFGYSFFPNAANR
jgi:hypothetical protein